MIERMKPEFYSNVLSLYAKLRFNLVVDSVIAGNTPAWVFVDRVDGPTLALMWNRQGDLLLAGAEGLALKSVLKEVIHDEIIPEARSRGIPQLALYYTPASWEGEVDGLFGDLEFKYARRRFYTSSKIKLDWRAHLPVDFEIRPIDRYILQNQEIDRGADIAGWIRSFWHSEASFLNTGFGYYLFHQDKALSWCLTVYASERHFEFGLATPSAYRRRGYATLVSAACVEHCTRYGWTPHWHTWEDNLGSIAVAQKVGFEKAMAYRVLRIQI